MKHSLLLFAATMLTAILMALDPALAQEYPRGHQAMEVWDAESIAAAPAWIKIWLFGILIPVLFAGVFFVRHRKAARWVFGGFILSFFPPAVLADGMGLMTSFSGMIALCHVIFWAPGLYFLVAERAFVNEQGIYAIWSAAAVFVIVASFFFDIPNAIIYLGHIMG